MTTGKDMQHQEAGDVVIRRAVQGDIPALDAFARGMGQSHEAGYFARCLEEQAAARRQIFLAIDAASGVLAGYVQLNDYPLYAAFRRFGLPEVQDLNVLPDFRGRGIGARLVTCCEDVARAAGKTEMGISVGLHASFGAAQRLYVRAGYMPDGAGIAYDDIPVRAGEMRAIDDNLTLKMTKSLAL
ncbi:MAG: GNAT family N-acetyltransferase [Alphaproteobacteria bacterium]|nr:GNAT family N-acetyltransferase [Alphaproteobacteria bacterium]